MSIYDEIEQRKNAQNRRICEELERSPRLQKEVCNHICRLIKDIIIQVALGKEKTKMKSGIWGSKLYYIGCASVNFYFYEGCRIWLEDTTIAASADFIGDTLVQVLRNSREDNISIYVSTVSLKSSDFYSIKWLEPHEDKLKRQIKYLSLEPNEKNRKHRIYLYGRILAED